MNHQPSRRDFVKAAALAGGWSAAARACGAEGDDSPREKKSPLVDTHLHCFAGKDDKRFPYHPRGPYQPPEAATPEHLLACMRDGGIDYAIVVHPEPYQDDHRYLEHCLKVGGGKLKGTLLLFADRPDSIKRMGELAKKLPVVTVRIHAYAPERLPPFGKPELKAFWRAAAENGLAVQLHFEPRYAAGFEPLIKEFADTTVIIDHLGRPFQGTPADYDAVVAWSKYPNTVMKISSLPEERMYPHRKIEPILKQLSTAFGAERLIYGGGFNGPQTTGKTYRAAFEHARALLSHLSADEQAQLFGDNAARLFKFG
jgi:predicted TIM-barrel fold metal-dependent hydrolase